MSLVTAIPQPAPTSRPLLIRAGAVLVIALGAIGWFAKYYPAPAPALAQVPPFSLASSALEQQLQLHPGDPALLIRAADFYFDHQNYARAAEFYRRALTLRPGDPDAQTDLGIALWQQGQTDAAVQQLQFVLTRNPNHPRALDTLGLALLRGKHDAPAAIAVWQRLLDTTPHYSGRPRIEALLGAAKASSSARP